MTTGAALRADYRYAPSRAQTAFAIAGYDLEARLARWILMRRDRIGVDELSLTHEFLTAMLGTRRSGVTQLVLLLPFEAAAEGLRGRRAELYRSRPEERDLTVNSPPVCGLLQP